MAIDKFLAFAFKMITMIEIIILKYAHENRYRP